MTKNTNLNGIMQKAKKAGTSVMKKMSRLKENMLGMMAMRKIGKQVKKLRRSIMK